MKSGGRGKIAKGQFVAWTRLHVERVGAIDALVLFTVAGIGAGQRAQRQQPRHEAQIGVRFAGRDKLVHLIGLGEVVARLGRSFADRLDRPVQIGDDFTDRNQLAALTLHALFSHVPQTRQGQFRSPQDCISAATVERQQLAENLVVGDVGGPTVRGSYRRVKGLVRIGEPLRPGVVEVRQRALLERLRRVLVAGNRPLRIAGNRLVHPLDPLGWVQPPVAQRDQPLSFQGYNHRAGIVSVVGDEDIRRQADVKGGV